MKDEKKADVLTVSYFIIIFGAMFALAVCMRVMYRRHLSPQASFMARKKTPGSPCESTQLLLSEQGRLLGEKITALQVYHLRYKAAYYDKSVDQDNSNHELESINFDFTIDVEALCLALKNSETRRETPEQPGKAFTRHQANGEVKMVVNHAANHESAVRFSHKKVV